MADERLWLTKEDVAILLDNFDTEVTHSIDFDADGHIMLADMQSIARVSPGHLLRRYRENNGMTQKGLASAAFCSVMMIRKIESGIRRPSHHLAHKLADALKVAPTHRTEFVRLLRSLPELPDLSQPIAEENPEQPEK